MTEKIINLYSENMKGIRGNRSVKALLQIAQTLLCEWFLHIHVLHTRVRNERTFVRLERLDIAAFFWQYSVIPRFRKLVQH